MLRFGGKGENGMAQNKGILHKIKETFDQRSIIVASAFIIFIALLVIMVTFAVNVGPAIAAREAGANASAGTVSSESGNKASAGASGADKLPSGFTTVSVARESLYKGPLILVNNDHKCGIDGVNLVGMMEEYNKTFKVADYDVQVNGAIMENINSMFGDFHDEYGDNDLLVNSAYRSQDVQQTIYDNTLASRGEEGTHWVAKPGYSEHQTGYAFDLSLMAPDGTMYDYDGTGNYGWINENCSRYGFVVRYDDKKKEITGIANEPWHFRYVGQQHAIYMVQNDLCLEEYIDLLRDYSAQEPLLLKDLSMNEYKAYFVKAQESGSTEVPVPQDGEYEISGNNVDGYIVTWKL